MLFRELALPGAYVVRPERLEDSRGYFARTFCSDEFTARGLAGNFVQCSTSFNVRRGTLRGMHFQSAPNEEIKLVRCTRGAILDVIVDLRPNSPGFCQWSALELTARNGYAVYIPGGFAHGFQTLVDEAEVYYQMTERYHPESAAGVRWNDPIFGIDWPIRPPFLSGKDANYEDFRTDEIRGDV